ncbi:MAG TPA: carboxypeptidase-like regulatory domain-containing protein, partial [Puia sp.]|nr:carboxypeptidase-like regulatory domain-containing protein [Puia sp.]
MTKTKSVLLFLIPFLFIHVARAQMRFTISGTVKEKKSGEVMIGSTVYLLEIPKSGTVSNSYGFYSISAPAGSYTMIASFAGYRQDTIYITLDKNMSTVIELEQK